MKHMLPPYCLHCIVKMGLTLYLSLGEWHNATSLPLSEDISTTRSKQMSSMGGSAFSYWNKTVVDEPLIKNSNSTANMEVEVYGKDAFSSFWHFNVTGIVPDSEWNSTLAYENNATNFRTFFFGKNFTQLQLNDTGYFNLTEVTSMLTDNVTGAENLNATYDDVGPGLETGLQNPALAVFLGLFCVFTIFGNILVMAAVARERYLHTVTNYFIVSLATADCLVGTIVMPFSVVHEAMDKFWIFGQDWCDVWHSVDVLGSTASILNLCVISLDRYWAITDPITYPSKMTTKRACILIGVVWVCASLISFPAIAWWRAVSTERKTDSCIFTEDIGYLVFSSIISFYGPLTVMVFTYYRIYRAAAEQTRSLRLGTKQVLACNGEEAMELTLRIHRGGTAMATGGFTGNNGSGRRRNYHPVYPLSPVSPGDISETLPLSIEDLGKNNSIRIVPKNLKHFSFSRKLARMAKEQKAAKTLGIVMGVFVLCWMPFFLCNVLLGLCSEHCFEDAELVSSVVTWLGWINSGMNPVIYACWSRDFRRAFTKILCVCCPRIVSRSNRQRLRSHVCQSISTPLSSTCSTECVRL